MQLLDFDGIPLPDRMATYDIPATTALSRLNIVGGMGGYVVGAKRETRKYRVDGLYLSTTTSPSEAQQTLDRLRGAMGKKSVLRQKMKDGSIRQCNAWLVGVSPVNNHLTYITTAQPVTLDFESDELWYDDTLILIEPAASTTMIAFNSGNAVSRNIKITISPAANAASLTLTCGNVSLAYDAALTTSDTLVIDAIAGTVTKNGANVYGNTTRPDTQMALFELAIGENTITASAAVTGRVEYRECWV